MSTIGIVWLILGLGMMANKSTRASGIVFLMFGLVFIFQGQDDDEDEDED